MYKHRRGVRDISPCISASPVTTTTSSSSAATRLAAGPTISRFLKFALRCSPHLFRIIALHCSRGRTVASIRAAARAISDGSYPAGAIGKVYVYSSSPSTSHTATGTHMPYGMAQCYLPPGRGDLPAFTPANAGTRFSYPGGMQG